ncbi:uncharacterized protein [Euwallacea similis]|uniref:uncharacterized protein isoform X2 n=1 Tax=Euwallacea similis TaxID=1736056 RepID=UPI00344D4128
MTALLVLLVALAWTKAEVLFEVTNKEPGPIWVGIQGDPGHAHLSNGGFDLSQGQTVIVSAPNDWSGKFWPRTWCEPTRQHCETGSCGDKIPCNGQGGTPPYTLIEITLNGYKGLDYYGLSLIEGMNLRANIVPVDGQGVLGDEFSCTKIQCLIDINSECPDELRLIYAGQTIGCKSPCTKFNTDMYCCRGQHDRPETCNSTEWPKDYANTFFKEKCPDAYSYIFDPNKGTFTCKASRYRIQFGASF